MSQCHAGWLPLACQLSAWYDAQGGVAFSNTDFSLWAFRSVRRNSEPHRLKPVLLDLRRIVVRNAE
jgi:hypothetical protein